MSLVHKIISKLPHQTAYAHCDIPCGIYDPTPAQMAAQTVLRMTQMLEEADRDKLGEKKYLMHISRVTHVKEEHAHGVEDELGTLENDYFKPEHFEKYPELKELIEKTVKLSVKCRQEIDAKLALEMLENTRLIAEIFYKTKNFVPVRIDSGYPTGEQIVSHK